MKRYFPWLVLVVCGAWLASSLRLPKQPEGMDLRGFGRLPVLLSGRTQPMDSVARNALLILRGKQTVPVENSRPLTALQWFMEVCYKPEAADQRAVFRIDHPELRSLLDLSPEEKFFSFSQFETNLMKLSREAERLAKDEIKTESMTPFEKAVTKLHQNVVLYRRIKNTLKPEQVRDFAADVSAYESSMEAGVRALRDREAGRTDFDQKAMDSLLEHLQPYDIVRQFAYALIIPSGSPNHDRDDWSNLGQALMEAARAGSIPAPAKAYASMASAYKSGDSAAFNTALSGYREWLVQHGYQPEVAKGRNEHYFNFLEPFYKSSALYVLAFILACVSLFNQIQPVRVAALWLLGLTFLVHTVGLIYRMVLEGRPPVTNLYSSAIFIGWGICGLGLIIEKFFKNALGTLTAAMGGFVTLIIAHNLSLGGDTMEMMRAVLDTNFWLATHVVVITLGYSATFMAGALGILYILIGVLSTSLNRDLVKQLSRMVYGILCFATLFSFVGTVLGGIWADQSWGRFWGWDPKENGALLIVIWNAIYLHLRWGKLASERTLMAVAVFGNVITAFSWFGVNMLGIGLHSYGFMDAAFKWLLIFDISQLLIIALAYVPYSRWRSGQSVASA